MSEEIHEHDMGGILCDHVAGKKRPILYVTHEHDGTWGFYCGYDDHDGASSYVGICRQCTLSDIEEFRLLRELKPGFDAFRETAECHSWTIDELPKETDTT